MDKLELPNTLLGIDAVYRKKPMGSDLSEARLLDLLTARKGKIVVTVIGGQGHVFGRGNQHSPRVLRRVGKENIIVAATEDKILGLKGQPLLVDTGDPEIDAMLCGYTKVVVGLHKRLAYRIAR
jgi:predicted polyphosphate/ATP-dependent NAD kinase